MAYIPSMTELLEKAIERLSALTPFPYVIFYCVAADEIVLSRLRHTARRPLPDK